MTLRPGLMVGLWLGTAVTGLAGCGSNAGPSRTLACNDVASARCNLRSTCSSLAGVGSGPGFSLVRIYGDLSTCIQRETLACENGLTAPGTGNNAAKVEMCVSAFGTYSCQDFFDNNPPAACTVTGSRASGASCTFNGQCQSGYCQGVKTSVCGTCADSPAGGADCTDSTCGHNQRCVAASMTCGSVVSLNGSCDATHPCDNGLACPAAAGTCETAGTTLGAACGGGMPGCDGTLGLTCGGATGAKTCVAISLVDAGMPCGTLADGSRAECKAGDCYTTTGLASGTDMGTCKAAALETSSSSACDTVLGPGCLPPARCVVTAGATSGACVVPTAAMCPS